MTTEVQRIEWRRWVLGQRGGPEFLAELSTDPSLSERDVGPHRFSYPPARSIRPTLDLSEVEPPWRREVLWRRRTR